MLEAWLNGATTALLGMVLFLGMVVASLAGYAVHRWANRFKGSKKTGGESSSLEGNVVSAVLGLLALLLGFTYSMAVDRYETRRGLVLEESRAIGTAYLRAQLLEDPHRTRLSEILVNYAENRLILATALPEDIPPLLAKNDGLLVDLWAATAAGFDSIRNIDFSSTLVDSMNNVIENDAARKAARLVRVPSQVYLVLFIYMCIAAGVLGYILIGLRNFIAAIILYMLLTLSVLLIIDIDRPTTGTIREAQGPMERLVESFRQRHAGDYDRWRSGPRPGEAAPRLTAPSKVP